jgi:hypothetical protein
LKQQRQKIGEVTAPDGPAVASLREVPLVFHAAGLELPHKRFVAGEEKIIPAATDPEQTCFALGALSRKVTLRSALTSGEMTGAARAGVGGAGV